MNWQETKDLLFPCLPEEIRVEMDLLMPGELREIRLRADRPAQLVTCDRTATLGWQPSQEALETLVEALSGHSLYARSDETAQGYITLPGGHRCGLCGRVISPEGQRRLSRIGSVCLRIAAPWPGCADVLLPHLLEDVIVRSMLIIGPCGSGKTTLLRDAARQLSESCVQVAMIDERGELAACLQGVPQMDLGPSADVLDNCPKRDAFPWLIRSLSPQAIITDELSGPEDFTCVSDAVFSGAAVIASIHGVSLQDVARRPAAAALLSQRVFDRYAVLDSHQPGQIIALYDKNGGPL